MKYPNKYIEKEDFTVLEITSAKFGVFEFLIDKDDVEKVKQYQWAIFHVNKPKQNKQLNYASTSSKDLPSTLKILHRFVMNVQKGFQVDHIEGNTLDTRKEKLRICSALENGQNKALSVRGTSGVKGVCWDKRTEKWMAHIRINYHHKTLGYFNTIEEAAEARKQAEILLQGEYSRDYGNENIKLSMYDENGERLNKREINHTTINCTHCIYWNINKNHMCDKLKITKERWNKCNEFIRKDGY